MRNHISNDTFNYWGSQGAQAENLLDIVRPVIEEEILKHLKEFTEIGRRGTFSKETRYVVHTSTIPLATTIDHWRLMGDRDNSIPIMHSHRARGEKSCCHVDVTNNINPEFVRTNCPCRELPSVKKEHGEKPRYMCFLEYLNESYDNGLYKESGSKIPRNEISFCFNGRNIFENRLPVDCVKDKQVESWSHVDTIESIYRVLDLTTWFRKADIRIKKRTYSRLASFARKTSVNAAKSAVKQTLFTINGVIIKLLMCFPKETSDYRYIRSIIIKLFFELIIEYTETGLASTDQKARSTFLEMKNFYKEWKCTFHSGNFEERAFLTRYKFKSKGLELAFSRPLSGLRDRIECAGYSDQDFTESIAWLAVGAIMSVTRTLGHLPKSLGQRQINDFLKKMEEPLPSTPKDINYVLKSLTEYLTSVESSVKFGSVGTLFGGKSNILTRELEDYLISHINFEKKRTASFKRKVGEGGKLEDARFLMNLASKEGWKIPIRDLSTGEILEEVMLPKDLPTSRTYSKELFWISFQLVLNSLVKHYSLFPEHYYREFRESNGKFIYCPNAKNVRIITISEPGKERILIKGQSFLTWCLNPGSKLLQYSLSLLPEHEVGLTSSAHAWKHVARLDKDNPESYFIFDTSGKLEPDVFQCFQDWTESTDNMSRKIGITSLNTYARWIGFPPFYRKLLCLATAAPEPYEYIPQGIDIKPRRGVLLRGFMMGMPVTKSILHLTHVVPIYNSKRIVNNELRKRHKGRLPLYVPTIT